MKFCNLPHKQQAERSGNMSLRGTSLRAAYPFTKSWVGIDSISYLPPTTLVTTSLGHWINPRKFPLCPAEVIDT